TVNNGEIAIVLVNGDAATCKKISIQNDGIFLISLNPSFEPRFYSKKEVQSLPVEIIGKVVELRGKL
ncbi:MAG: S24 family peptidase, partial [Clostridia bacterium]